MNNQNHILTKDGDIMMKLTKVVIHRYKSIENEQAFDIDDLVTVFVGMNESGKTALLEAIAKSNYFEDDEKFQFNDTFDYPRKFKKAYDRSEEVEPVITCTYQLSKDFIKSVSETFTINPFNGDYIEITTDYENDYEVTGFDIDKNQIIRRMFSRSKKFLQQYEDSLVDAITVGDIDNIIEASEDDEHKELLKTIRPFYEFGSSEEDTFDQYLIEEFIFPNVPKYLYYSEYYSLPSEIDLNGLEEKKLNEESQKTVKALIELAKIDITELMKSDNFEEYIAELEATSIEISKTVFKYWKTNTNQRIRFIIENRKISEEVIPILHIRVENTTHEITLPLKNRSKGFNWFFSFIVWFSKIQEDKKYDYILLLDEPGINLHASAQADLLAFIEDLSKDHQILFTTHSPFMIDSNNLHRVRTLVETKKGTKVSETLQEKDPKTLFPLQAALGYDIAQNLFISKNNLLVEGPADLLYLTLMSNLLASNEGTGLSNEITIIPVGGLDKVSTFISLLRGSKLNIVCLLDTPKDRKGKSQFEGLITQKIIQENRVLFFHDFLEGSDEADIEDIFDKQDYIKFFNTSFEYKPISLSDLNDNKKRIVDQINEALSIDRYNHYRPAYQLTKDAVNADYFQDNTLERFQEIFNKVNELFKLD